MIWVRPVILKSSESFSGIPFLDPNKRPARKEELGSEEKVRLSCFSKLLFIDSSFEKKFQFPNFQGPKPPRLDEWWMC